MRAVSQQNFGIVIAYLVPGATMLAGVCVFSETAKTWMGAKSTTGPTISGFLYATLASVGLGIFCNTIRTMSVDRLHHATGIRKCDWSYRVLQDNIAAVEFLVLNQFRYHQFHGNMMVAVAFTYGVYLSHFVESILPLTISFVCTEVVLLLGSRKCLSVYYERLNEVLRPSEHDVHRSAEIPTTPDYDAQSLLVDNT